jgi:flagellar basal body P-ring formation protein FlgA
MRIAQLVATIVLLAPGAIPAQPGAGDPRLCATAARTLARGTTLAAADIVMASSVACTTTALPADSLVGRLTKRVVRAGEPLRAPAVVATPSVSAGEPVTLVVQQDGVRISMSGTATSAAMTGERVWVRLGAKQRIRGVVAGRDLDIVSDTSGTP